MSDGEPVDCGSGGVGGGALGKRRVAWSWAEEADQGV